jgi:hypothetical protein
MPIGDAQANIEANPLLLQRHAVQLFQQANRNRGQRDEVIEPQRRKEEETARSQTEILLGNAANRLKVVKSEAERSQQKAEKLRELTVECLNWVRREAPQFDFSPERVSASMSASDPLQALDSAAEAAQRNKATVETTLKELAEFNDRRGKVLLALGISFIVIFLVVYAVHQSSRLASPIVSPAQYVPSTSPPPVQSPPPAAAPVDTSGPPSNFIGSLNATVKKVRFFESGPNIPEAPARVYMTRFAAKGIRYINWDINLECPTHVQRLDFTINAVWYGPNDNEVGRHSMSTYVQPSWTNVQYSLGWGNANGGAFVPGHYRVDFFVDGQKIAVGGFEVYQGDATSSMYIPSIDATVAEPLRFFASSETVPPKNERTYQTEFSSSVVQYIDWELNLTCPERSERTDFTIREVWTEPDGITQHESSFNTHIDAGSSSSSPSGGFGRVGGGSYPTLGTYRVDLYIDNSKIASGTFQVIN